MSQEPEPLVKCLVWDLDNTLWQGTLLEDGEVHLADELRAVVTTLDQRGILQSVASKNEHDDAWQRLEALGIAEYFVHPQIGWSAKSGSVRTIADELSFAHNTIAFIDDQPAERAEVAFHLPEVRCYSADQATALVDLPEFSPATVTVDARRRREMYQAGLRRKSTQASYDGPDEDFLRSLEMEVRIGRATDADLSRVEELTLRTSQMNATGVHYSDATLRGLLDSPDHEVLVTTVSDRFGPHGAVGVLLLERHEKVWQLKLLATSCRVVTYGIGTVILNWLIDQAARAGVHLAADFRATRRNRMMDIAYRFAGFEEQDCQCGAAIAPEDDITRLHLLPSRRPAPDTMRLTAPEL
ncbi:HAD-IIIC family phosphatase [Saccharomonospora piscinae]|uniref:HAD-IIIC family phosphatase n=1 Tax=Saccharomonospora piscinae TaxID=687388 RepID=UPI0004ADAB2C|nr:HAD-IIIC family phosphatase [Saccharomonospora piscinae]TLW91370.1 HAD-IIIC family phosphatase [Saccharomonospora piscinae]